MYEDEGCVPIDHVICHMTVLIKKNLITSQDQLFMIWHPEKNHKKKALFFNWVSKYVFTNLSFWNNHFFFQLKIKPLNIKNPVC